MLMTVMPLTALGLALGFLLGGADRLLRVPRDELEEELLKMLPGSQCGQCGYIGCAGAAQALAKGEAPLTLCPPGGRAVAQAQADRLGVEMNLADMPDDVPRVAQVLEHLCIGCTRCFKVCPTDAVMGAAKQLHQVFGDACTACGKCQAICPTEAIQLTPVAPSLLTWGWERPLATREV